jgi:hypothetical protein
MDCERHFFNLGWEHHAWHRRVSATEKIWASVTDMWGRSAEQDHVRCATELVCDVCGAVKPHGDCQCDTARAEGCVKRLAFLGRVAALATRSAKETIG